MTGARSIGPWVSKERWRSWTVFAVVLVSAAYTFPRWADPNQNSRLDMVVAMVDGHTFQIDPYVGNTVDFAQVGNHYYSDKAPGSAVLGAGAYAAVKPLLALPMIQRLEARLGESEAFRSTLRPGGTGILNTKVRFALIQVLLSLLLASVPTALLAVGMYRWLANVTPSVAPRLLTTLAYGLLSPAFAYAGAFYGHQLSAALLFGAFLLTFGGREKMGAARLIGIGALLAVSVVTEYPSALIAVILGLYVAAITLRQKRVAALSWLLLASAPFVIAWLQYNTVVFGSPLNLGYSYSTLWLSQHHTGFMSLTLPHWESLWGVTFGSFRGLFILSPVMLLAAAGFVAWWRSAVLRAEFWVAFASAVSMFGFTTASIMWWGGFAVGPRYLLPGLPFLALGLAHAHRAWGRALAFRVTLGLACAWSLVATWGLTFAGQAFPSDVIRNPLLEYAWPNWLAGNVARNVGTLMGLRGAASLVPLAALLAVCVVVGWPATRGNVPALPAVEDAADSDSRTALTMIGRDNLGMGGGAG
jgi:hypothetical protein